MFILHVFCFPDSSVGKKSTCNARDPVQFLGQEDLLEKGRLPTPVFVGFPCGSAGKESTCNVGDTGSIPGLGRSLGEGKEGKNYYLISICILDYVNDVGQKVN